ncbi:MAG: peptide MFS transporter [bacterium]|nr:peptide MFS transporter [bacterium]
MSQPEVSAASQKQWFGHPRGLSTLFFTEMWERASYYGMRALLLLYMTDLVRGGLGMDVQTGAAIYGLYTFGVYALALPGGWVADRLVGQRRAVLMGGVVIAAGHYVLALPYVLSGTEYWSFYLGLFLVVVGTGLLKPNVSAIVGDLYQKDTPARRDAGFSIFYMGINVGAVLGPTVCSWLGEQVNWHLGFSVAGIGMTLGVIQYILGRRHLTGAGELKGEAATAESQGNSWRLFYSAIAALVVIVVVGVYLVRSSYFALTLVGFAQATGLLVLIVSVLYFAYMILFGCHDGSERKRVFFIFLLFLGAAMFWSGFEQAGSSFNLFGQDYTDRVFGGWEMPTGWLQNINPAFIIIFAPIMGMLWVKLDQRNPSIPVKFGAGLVLLGVGFLVLAWAANYIPEGAGGDPSKGITMAWLVATYFFHTIGELCLSPVGLSSITKLSPDRYVGQMMGMWFMGAALGNLIAGLIAGYIEAMPMPQLFSTVATIVAVFGLLFLIFSIPIKKLAPGIN